MHRFRLCAFGLLLTGAPALRGQSTAPNQAELIEKLLARVDQLEKRVAELETGHGPSPVVSALQPTRPAPAVHDHEATPSPLPAEPITTYPALKISGFGDVNFQASQQPGTKSGFNEGQFILHLTSALSPRVAYFGELSMTARTDAGTGAPAVTGFNVEVERSIIRFDQSDHLKLSFGRFHTPISYWNTAFHHGSWLQTTASRPESIQFGGSFIPVHFIGALAEGAVPSGGLNLNYNFGVGNGRSSVLSRGGDWGDVNNNRAWLAGAFLKPDKLYGLQVGGSVYRDKIDVAGRPETREWISSAHLVWTRETPEFIAEFFNVNHAPTGPGNAVNSQAWYAQTAYRLPGAAMAWKPYFRYEYIHVPQADGVYRGIVANVHGSTAGVRYDISSFAAMKLEWRNTDRFGFKNYNGLWMQTSFTF
jgi:hypothetical protein